jgi:hypothetical protein
LVGRWASTSPLFVLFWLLVEEKLDILQSTAEMLKRQVDEKEFVDVGAQVERALPLGEKGQNSGSAGQVQHALSMLKEEGYSGSPASVIQQAGTGEFTTYRVLVKPGVTQKDVFLNRDKIKVSSRRSRKTPVVPGIRPCSSRR